MKPITTLCLLLGTCLLAGAEGNPGGPVRPDNRVHPKGPPPREILEKFDKDGDGKLSDEEKKAMHEAMEARRKEKFKEFDTDGDGKLSEEERAKMKEAHKAEMLKKFDTDGDGELSEEERKAIPHKPHRPHGPEGKGRPGKHGGKDRDMKDADEDLDKPAPEVE